MKFVKRHPYEGETRIKRNRFLFLPYIIWEDESTTERRWLEKASWEETYTFTGDKYNGERIGAWIPSKWINE